MEEQASQGSFVTHGRQDVLTIAINRPKHPSHVHATEANVMIKYYFGPAPRGSRTSSSMAIEDLEQLTQKIKDQPQPQEEVRVPVIAFATASETAFG